MGLVIKAQAAAIFFAGAVVAAEPLATATNHWSFTASLAARETYDDNVYLQSRGPKADRDSFVTSVLPQAGVTWRPCPSFDATAAYSGGLNWFHDETSEDYGVHRGSINWNARIGESSVQSQNSIVGIDGRDLGPTWAAPGAAPATGGPAVRDRYDALVYRNSIRVLQPFGDWFARPTATWYSHDWGTEERSTPGYQNFVDRNEWTAGPDIGRKLRPDLSVFSGYRYGQQHENQLLRFPEQYDNDFHRVLIGGEGKLLSWLSINAAFGPEFRHYADTVAAGFDRSRLNLYLDAAVTLTPSDCDTVVIGARQFQQPGFAGRSAYNDLTYDFDWRRKIGKQFTVAVGNRAYNTYFLRSTKRNDWVLTPNLSVNYAATPHWNFEISGGHEFGFTGNEGFDGRDYERTFINLGVKYTWK